MIFSIVPRVPLGNTDMIVLYPPTGITFNSSSTCISTISVSNTPLVCSLNTSGIFVTNQYTNSITSEVLIETTTAFETPLSF